MAEILDDQKKKYRDELVQQIKDAGQELIDRAEFMVAPDLDLISNFDISISFAQDEFPTIRFTTEVVNKTTIERMFRRKDD